MVLFTHDIKICQKDQRCRWQKRVNLAPIQTGTSVNVAFSRCRTRDELEIPRFCFSGSLRTLVTRSSDSTVAASTGSVTGRTSLTRMRYQARVSYKGWKRWVHRVADPRGEYLQRPPPPPPALGPNYRSGTVNSNTVNSKFHLIRSFFEIFARFLSFHV